MKSTFLVYLVFFSQVVLAQTFRPQLVKEKRAEFVNNSFLQPCLNIDSPPTFANALVNVSEIEGSNNYYLNLKFKLKGYDKVYLRTNKNKLIEAESSNDVYNVSALQPKNKRELQLQFAIRSPKGEIFNYIVQTTPFELKARISANFTLAQKQKICLKNQLWFGYGASLFSYNQKISSLEADAQFVTAELGSYHFDSRLYLNTNWGVLASHKSARSQVKKGELQDVESTDIQWDITEVGVQYRRTRWLIERKNQLIYPYLRASVQQHKMPRLGVDNSSVVFFDKIENTQLALGAGANVFRRDSSFFEAYLNYQLPLAEGSYKLKPDIEFDGAIGYGRQLRSNFALGVFWHGQYRKFSYSDPGGRDAAPGEISFFFSNVDFRLGYVF